VLEEKVSELEVSSTSNGTVLDEEVELESIRVVRVSGED